MVIQMKCDWWCLKSWHWSYRISLRCHRPGLVSIVVSRSHYSLMILLSLANTETESEANSNNNLTMRLAGSVDGKKDMNSVEKMWEIDFTKRENYRRQNDEDEIFIWPWYIGSPWLSHATAKLMSLFHGWRKSFSLQSICFSTQFVQPSYMYTSGKPTPQNVHWKYATKHASRNTEGLLLNYCSRSRIFPFHFSIPLNSILKHICNFVFTSQSCGWIFLHTNSAQITTKFIYLATWTKYIWQTKSRTVGEEDDDLEFETELRNSWLLWEVSEGWWVGERISQCEIGHRWLRQILRLKFLTFLVRKIKIIQNTRRKLSMRLVCHSDMEMWTDWAQTSIQGQKVITKYGQTIAKLQQKRWSDHCKTLPKNMVRPLQKFTKKCGQTIAKLYQKMWLQYRCKWHEAINWIYIYLCKHISPSLMSKKHNLL